MAHPEEPPRPITDAGTGTAPAVAPPARPGTDAMALLLAALFIVSLGYLAVAVPGAWFRSAAPKEWSPRAFTLARGAGGIQDDALLVAAGGGAVGILVSLETDFRASDYRAIAWGARDIPADADVRLLWRSDYFPLARPNSAQVTVAAGQLLPVILAGNPKWIGRITGLALAINGPTPEPVRIEGVAAKPMGAVEIVGDRLAEWFAFEGYSGTSINNIAGGADVQDLPLPVLLATAAGLAALAGFGLARYRGRAGALPATLATIFVAAWLLQDGRWAWNLVRQARATAVTYAGLDWRDRHLAAEDAPLFQFIESVRAKLPAEPARVFMYADAPYFRGRGAYHLYPHNVFYEPYVNAIPASSQMRPGDYVVAYRRRGIQYDAGTQRLQWDGGEPVSAELILTAPDAALFRIR